MNDSQFGSNFGGSRMSNIKKMTSHLKSVMPELNGRQQKKYVSVRLYKSLNDNKGLLIQELIQNLQIEFQNLLDLKYFEESHQILKQNILDNQLYYLIVPDRLINWAQSFATEERQNSDDRKKIHVFGILKQNTFQQKQTAKQKKRIDKVPTYIDYYQYDDNQYPQDITQTIQANLSNILNRQQTHLRTWSITNKYAQKKLKRRTLHFYYEHKMQQELVAIYKKYKKKSISSWVQIHSYQTFNDIVANIYKRQVHNNRQVDNASRVSSNINFIPTNTEIQMNTLKTIIGSNSSSAKLNTANNQPRKNYKNDLNIIICNQQHPEILKFTAFVKAQKLKNWQLLKIDEEKQNFYVALNEILQAEKQRNEHIIGKQQLQCIKSKTLNVLIDESDQYTREMFENHDNIFHNMKMLQYNDPDQFSLLLRSGVNSFEDFTVATVKVDAPYTNDYIGRIKQFNSQYKNTDHIENFKFILCNRDSHQSVFLSQIRSSMGPGVQGASIFQDRNENWLDQIMTQRDQYFHPFHGLKGGNVYLLVRDRKQHLLQELRKHIASSARLHVSTYIDKQFLNKQLKTIQIKDSAVVITDDDTLRQAQEVVKKFNEVYIMNITDRPNVKEEIKVMSWGKKQRIHQLITSIPQPMYELKDETYDEGPINSALQLKRPNRILPKEILSIPGNVITLRLPAHLSDDQSRKMQVRLKKYFKDQIKIQYYQKPQDIRMTNKLDQPFTYIILTSKKQELDYMKVIAQEEIKQLRQEFILYDENPESYRYLIQQPKYQRFKFLSNRWQKIQSYILGSREEQEYDQMYEDEKVHLFVDKQGYQNRQVLNNIIGNQQKGMKAASLTQVHHTNNIQEVILEQSIHHKYYIVAHEDQNRLNINDGYRIINNKPNLDKKCKMIVVGNNRQLKDTSDSIRSVQQTQADVSHWVSNTKVLPVVKSKGRPYVINNENSLDWYYFLNKYSHLTNQFHHRYANNKDQLVREVKDIRAKDPKEQIWVIAKNKKQLVQSSRVTDAIPNAQPLKYIMHSNQNTKYVDLNKKITFIDPNRKQCQAYILNAHRRSDRVFFPSSVRNPETILAVMRNRNGSNYPINKNQLQRWRNVIDADVMNFDTMEQLNTILSRNPYKMVYVVYPKQIDDSCGQILQGYPNVRRIIHDQSYNTRNLGRNYITTNKKIYMGSYPAEVTNYLSKLRYNIRNPAEEIEKQYPEEITQIFTLKKNQISTKDQQRLLAYNDSIATYQPFQYYHVKDMLQKASMNKYNTIFVGDTSVQHEVDKFNASKNTNYKFINASADQPYSKVSAPLALETNEKQQQITYLGNLSENRYNKAKAHHGDYNVYYNVHTKNSKVNECVKELKQVQNRNNCIKINGYEDVRELQRVSSPSIILIDGKDEQKYQQKMKPNNNVNFFTLNSDQSRNLISYGNKYFTTKNNTEHYRYLCNLRKSGNQMPKSLGFNLSNDGLDVIRVINSMGNTKPVDPQKFKLNLLPPFQMKKQPKAKAAIPQLSALNARDNLLDREPELRPKVHAQISKPPQPLGLQVIKHVKNNKINKQKYILQTGLDEIATKSNKQFMSTNNSDLYFKSNAVEKPEPKPQEKLAVVYPYNQEYHKIGQMLKQNLQPDQYDVDLLPFKSQHELQQFAYNNGQKLQNYDKVVVFLSKNYAKYQKQLKNMKNKSRGKLEYFFFDDNFYQKNHQILKNHLQPFIMKNCQLPFINSNQSKYLKKSKKIKVMVPPQKEKSYKNIQNSKIKVSSLPPDSQMEQKLHQKDEFNVILCDKPNYNHYKKFQKYSPRLTVIVQDDEDLKQDEFVLHSYEKYCSYYGDNPRKFINSKSNSVSTSESDIMKVLFYHENDEDGPFEPQYNQFQKVQYENYPHLYNLLMHKHEGKQNFLYKKLSNNKVDIVPLNPKVYLENQDYMKDFKNDFLEKGYLNEDKIQKKQNLRSHDFVKLPEIYYKDHKDLARALQEQDSPSIAIINSGNKNMLSLMRKQNKHRIIPIMNNLERWISPEGTFPQIYKDNRLKKKQKIFEQMFTQQVFDSFNDMGYFYLSNRAQIDRKRNIYFRAKEDVLDIYQQTPNLLMVLFVQSTDTNYIPPQLLTNAHSKNSRVKIVLIQTKFVDDNRDLFVKFNQIDPVITRINNIEDQSRINILMYDQIPGEIIRKQLIQNQQLVMFENQPYRNLKDVENISKRIKGKYRKVYVICFKNQMDKIDAIFKKYAIRDKGLSNQGVDYVLIDEPNTITKPISSSQLNVDENSKFIIQQNKSKVSSKVPNHQTYFTSNSDDLNSKLKSQSKVRSSHINYSTNEFQQQQSKYNEDQTIVCCHPQTTHQLKLMRIEQKHPVKLKDYRNTRELEDHLRRYTDNSLLVFLKKNEVQDAVRLKKKYDNAILILDEQISNKNLLEKYHPLIVGQVRNNVEIQKIIRQIYEPPISTLNNSTQFRESIDNCTQYGTNIRQEMTQYDVSQVSAKKRIIFYKDPANKHIKSRLGRNYKEVQCIGYKNTNQLRKLIRQYPSCLRTVIANGRQIIQIQQDLSNQMGEQITIIRFQPHYNVSDYPRVRKLLSTHSKQQLGNFINKQFGNNYVSLRAGQQNDFKILLHDKFQKTSIRITEQDRNYEEEEKEDYNQQQSELISEKNKYQQRIRNMQTYDK